MTSRISINYVSEARDIKIGFHIASTPENETTIELLLQKLLNNEPVEFIEGVRFKATKLEWENYG